MAVTWTDPPSYIDPAIISATDWNLSLRDNQHFLVNSKAFRYYFGAFGGTDQPNLQQSIVSAHGTATGGSWRASYNGVYTPYLSYNATNLEVSNALGALPGLCTPIRLGCIPRFTLYGTSLNSGFTMVLNPIYFTGPVQLLITDSSLLIGDTVSVTALGTTGTLINLVFSPDPAIPHVYSALTAMEPGIWCFNAQIVNAGFSNVSYSILRNASEIIAQTRMGTFTNRPLHMRGYKRVVAGDFVGIYSDSTSLPVQGTNNTWFEGSWIGA